MDVGKVLSSFLVAWCALGASSGFGFDVSRQYPLAVLENERVRDYLRRRLLSAEEYWKYREAYERGWFDPELEHRVDLLAVDLAAEVAAMCRKLDADLKKVERTRRELSGQPRKQDISRFHSWRRQLRQMEDDARKLRRMLAPLFPQLRSKDELGDVEWNPEDIASLFEPQVERMREDLVQAVRLVESFFFHPGAVVGVQTLKRGNMLILLYRIEQTARILSRQGFRELLKSGGASSSSPEGTAKW
ncbi:MAG: hypothetical protein Kow00109_13920 [Acidobacteriota bacterium]